MQLLKEKGEEKNFVFVFGFCLIFDTGEFSFWKEKAFFLVFPKNLSAVGFFKFLFSPKEFFFFKSQSPYKNSNFAIEFLRPKSNIQLSP